MIIWSAIKYIPTGRIVIGKRHNNCFETFCEQYPELKVITTIKKELIQGFLTDEDQFLTRREAAKLAFNCGQIEKEQIILFSEDLW